MKITGFYLEDYRLILEDDVQCLHEAFPCPLLMACDGQTTGEKLKVSNVLTSRHGIYGILVLIKKQGMEPDVYESLGSCQVMVHPAKSFRIQMGLDRNGALEVHVWIHGDEFLFYGITPSSLVTVTGRYPMTRTIFKEDWESDRECFLASQFEKLPCMEVFVKDFLDTAEKKLKQSTAPAKLLEHLRHHDIRIREHESIHAYFSRLFNILSSTKFNLDSGGLLSLDESGKVSTFISRTILEGRVFE
jgi:hypothetical protein